MAFACNPMAAHAATSETATSEAYIVTPLSLSKYADLDFGTIVSPAAAGTVVLTPAPVASCAMTGGLIHSGVCQAAVFFGFGASGQIVKVKMPNGLTTTLAGPGGATMTVTNMSLDGDPSLVYVSGNVAANGFVRYTIAAPSGLFSFRVGGTLNVGAAQAIGVYTGSFDMNVSYQ